MVTLITTVVINAIIWALITVCRKEKTKDVLPWAAVSFVLSLMYTYLIQFLVS